MSLYDFYMYLKYIEFSAENLEFYIWCVPGRVSHQCPGPSLTRRLGSRTMRKPGPRSAAASTA